MKSKTSDYLRLHSIVILFGFTGILGKLVSIPAVEMVFFRTLLAALGMGLLLILVKGNFAVSRMDLLRLALTGMIVSIHWLTFFVSARVANVSVSLVGFATASFWTALLEPAANKTRIKVLEIILGLIVAGGLLVIFSFDFGYSLGLAIGIFSGLTCAIFSIINSQLVKRIDSYTITFYEMISAAAATALFLPFYREQWAEGNQLRLLPTAADWGWILLLAWLCTVYAYSTAVELTKRISVFFFQLTLNLEPVYGILMAVAVFGEVEKMDLPFYAGTLIIFCAVMAYPVLKEKFTTNQPSIPGY